MYASASGMLTEAARHETIANNLANVTTTGFKHDVALVRQHPSQQIHRIYDNLLTLKGYTTDLAPALGTRGQGAIVDAISTYFTQGSLMETNNPTDIAIRGQGFFMVATDRGRRYTRQGSFSIDGLGRLVTQSGDPLLTITGAPVHVDGKTFEVNPDGTIFLDGMDSGRLAVMMPDDIAFMVKEGESLYAPAPGARFRASSATLSQGHLERANVNAVLEMAAMLQALRSYEANQRAIVAQDGTLNTLISQVGRFG